MGTIGKVLLGAIIGGGSVYALKDKLFNTETSDHNSILTYSLIPNSTCGPCCDTSQIEFHHAKAIVFNCMDFRLRDNVTCHLNSKGYNNSYDEVIAAGASLGYNGLSTFTHWDSFVDEHIMLAFNLHDISTIVIVEHEKCGAYKVQYGHGSSLTPESEYKYHIDNSKTCADTLWSKFNSESGTVLKIPELRIVVYLISIDASSFDEIYSLKE